MKTGKISNSILKRSVLKRIDSGHPLLQHSPVVGCEYAVFAPPCSLPVAGPDAKYRADNGCCEIVESTDCGMDAVYRTANSIAACGAVPVAAQYCVVLPEKACEQELKEIISALDGDCTTLKMALSGGRTQVSPAVTEPVVTVTGMGFRPAGWELSAEQCAPKQDIVMTKWIGIGGIRELTAQGAAEILERYSPELLEKAAGKRVDLSVLPEAALAAANGATALYSAAEGGIYAALWNLAEAGQVGLDVDFRSIPVRQEVIEICELFDINPYELESSGCLLMTTPHGCDIVKVFKKSGIPAQIIGRTTAGNDRLLRNQDEVRYLEPPKPDEMYRFTKMRIERTK